MHSSVEIYVEIIVVVGKGLKEITNAHLDCVGTDAVRTFAVRSSFVPFAVKCILCI